jgi:hypothetical protein
VGEVEAVEVVGVADELGDDLTEAERDDGEVVAAERRVGRPMKMPPSAVTTAALRSTSQIEMWMPRASW